MNPAEPEWLCPRWPAPAAVRALFSTRRGGASSGPYASLNLADHVGDAADAVASNRAVLCAAAGLPGEPVWLRQVHGVQAVALPSGVAGAPEADAAWTRSPGVVCAVLVADCAPILLCDRAGRAVAAVHAGWRGALAGVIERAVAALLASGCAAQDLLAWIGPCISVDAFEVGPEVHAAFVADDAGAARHFRPAGGRWHADLPALCERRLRKAGVSCVTQAALCTHRDASRFYSHRRDGPCGRMAAVIWIDQNPV